METTAKHIETPWRRNLAVIAVAQFLTILGFAFTFPFLPLFVRDLGVEDPGQAAFWSGVAGGAMGATLFLTGPLWGIFGDRYGRKPNMLRTLFGSAVMMVLTGLSANVYQLVIFRFLMGLVSGVVATSMALVAYQTPRERIGFAVGVLLMSMFAGATVGPLAGAFLTNILGFRSAFYANGALIGLASTGILLFVRQEFERPSEMMALNIRGYARDFVSMVTARDMFIALCVLLAVHMTQATGQLILPLFMEELSLSISAITATGIAFGLMGFCSAIASLAVARLSGKLGLKRILEASSLMAGLFLAPMYLAQSMTHVFILTIFVGLFAGATLTTANAYIAVLVPMERQGRAYGAVQSIHWAAIGLGSLLAGGLATFIGFRPIFLISAAGFLAVAPLVRRLVHVDERSPKKEGEAAPA